MEGNRQRRPPDNQGPAQRFRRIGEGHHAAAVADGAGPFAPSDGARLTFQELLQSPPQPPAPETHFPVIGRAERDPQGLTLLDFEMIPNADLPGIQLLNPDGSAGYAMVRNLRNLNHHGRGWGELWAGIQFSRFHPPQQFAGGTFYRGPPPGEFVAIKKLNKRVVDLCLQRGNNAPIQFDRDLSHLDDAYMAQVLPVCDRENPYREMSRMDEFGDNIHVLRQKEFLQDNEFIYMILPYGRGRVSLDRAMFRPQQELAPEEARSLFLQILQILAYLEEMGIHHRDLSPDNFLFLDEDHLVAMDLAMSLRIPVDATTGQRTLILGQGVQGTPAFMCPEIFNNFQVFDGVMADLWSAMLILYGMLTNLPLYRRPNALEDISYRFYVVAGGLTQNDVNELVVEVLEEVFYNPDGNPAQRHVLFERALAHLGLSPAATELFGRFFHINPAQRWTLADVMESPFVAQQHPDEDVD